MPAGIRNVEDRWRALWEESPQRSPFSRLSYVRHAASASGLNVHVHFVEEAGRDTAGVAVTWSRRGPYRSVVLPPFTPFSAVLLREQPAEADVHSRSSPLGAILREVERNYHAARIHLHPSIQDVRPAQWRGWEAQPLYTYVLQLTENEEILAGWSASAARNFRSARDGYELLKGDEAASAAVALVRDSYARHGRSAPMTETDLRSFVHKTSELSDAYAVRRRDSGKRIDAAIVTLSDFGRTYYWIAGSVPGNAMTVLVGELLSRLDPHTTQLFDFVGANTPSIAEFKRRFGCELENYYRIAYFGRKDLRILHVLRDIFRR